MRKLHNMRLMEIPEFGAISSGVKTFGQLFGDSGFCQWLNDNDHLIQKQIFDEAVGIAQQQIFLPLKFRTKS